MRLVKLLPVVASLVIGGCSFQHHTERAERKWLTASAQSNALFSVNLLKTDQQSSSDRQTFMTAGGATTYLRGQLELVEIDELSGVAAVTGSDDLYWGINDSGNLPRLYAFHGSGKHVAAFEIDHSNRDWEDLASFQRDGSNWIAISETGDNMRRHATSTIVVVKQPERIPSSSRRLSPQYRIDFVYEDGPRNVESMAVSVEEGRIYLIAKDHNAANIYTLPLEPASSSGVVVAQKTGRLQGLPSTSDDTWWERWFAGRFLSTPTAFDISADNRTAVVANYRHVYLFRRGEGERWSDALSREPELLTTHRMMQSEAVAFSADSREIIVGSEGAGAPLLSIRPTR